ncbi:MAG: MerR family transcriptional regulator [Alphaproteobacteria bacterium]|jgi:DNA-binding transcriptional MerR regulator|nr:MerR family transcriptional regulator [Alphaproteobacteria bacterium]|tara:strand:+ start:411 stop:722 length:312 start_codon:yes stop_codon:yes gene_type:complete
MKSPEALKTIGEVAKIVNVPIYVLRFWEKKINLIAPIKKKNGTRYYNNSQITIIETLKNLLYIKKYSIDGANRQLSKEMSNVNEKEKIIKDLKELIIEINKLI